MLDDPVLSNDAISDSPCIRSSNKGFVLERDEVPILLIPDSEDTSWLMLSFKLLELNKSTSVLPLIESLLFSIFGRVVAPFFDKASFNVVESADVADVIEGESFLGTFDD